MRARLPNSNPPGRLNLWLKVLLFDGSNAAKILEGVNMGLGTDTYPHNYLEEMRSAANHARTIAGTVDDVETADIFNAATIGGAKALCRDDIGRLAAGARADLVLVDLRHPSMMPVREPLRSLIYVAADRAIRDVYVEGQLVLENGTPLNIDLATAAQALEEAQHRSLEQVPNRDWACRNADELAPMVFSTSPKLN